MINPDNITEKKQPVQFGGGSSQSQSESTPAPTDLQSIRTFANTGTTKKDLAKAETSERLQLIAKLQTQAEASNESDTQNAEPLAHVETLQDYELPDTLMDMSLNLDPSQEQAVAGCLVNKYAIVNGAAGSGKTTTIKAVIHSLIAVSSEIDRNRAKNESNQYNVPHITVNGAIMAYTGRASQQVKRAVPAQFHDIIDTIHGTLGFYPIYEDYYDEQLQEHRAKRVFVPYFTEDNKLPFEWIVIDEFGMVPESLWLQLLAALPDKCRIYGVGDINQLPPVMGKSVFGFALQSWPTFTLTEIHRQAEGNIIIENAHRILRGNRPTHCKKEFIMHEIPDNGLEAFSKTKEICNYLFQKGVYKPLQHAIIVPQNIDIIGQEHFNEVFAPMFNRDGDRQLIKANGKQYIYAVGDKVMLCANDRERGLTNGQIGVITAIAINGAYKGKILGGGIQFTGKVEDLMKSLEADQAASIAADVKEELIANPEDADTEKNRAASHIIDVKFENVDTLVTFSTASDFNDRMQWAYASTCHKSQGGEYDTVIVLCHSANFRMLNREWLYTAITRAKKRLILLYNQRGLRQALQTQAIKGNTIYEKAEWFNKLAGDKFITTPYIPAPQKLI